MHKQSGNKVIQEAKKVNELKHQDINLMKTQDKLKLMKEMKYQREFEMMKKAANEANPHIARQIKYRHMHNGDVSSCISYDSSA